MTCKLIKAAFSLLTAASLFRGQPLLAQEQEEEENLEEILEEEFELIQDDAQVVESSARHQQPLGLSPSAITVITRKDIEASGAVHLVDVLRLVPGMDVIQATPAFSAIDMRSIWSNKNSYVLVLLDGRDTMVGAPSPPTSAPSTESWQ